MLRISPRLRHNPAGLAFRFRAARLLTLVWVATLFGLSACESETSDGEVAQDVRVDVDATDPTDIAIETNPQPDTVVDSAPAEPADLTSTGPYNVGFSEESLTYEPSDDSGPRSLRVTLWYPTTDTEGTASTYGGLLPRPTAFNNAMVADLRDMPLVLFSHGNTSFAEQSYFLAEFLVSHGYVVAAVDHTGNTFKALGDPIPPEMFYLRPWDMIALLDHVSGFAEPHPLAGRVDTARVALSGHSFGGYTTLAVGGAVIGVDGLLAACQSGQALAALCTLVMENEATLRAGFADPRVTVLIPLTPGATNAFGAGIGAIDVPTLLVTGAMDRTTTNAIDGDPTWAALASDPRHRRIDFATAGHFSFSNACDLPGVGQNDGCGEGFLPVAEAHAATNAFVLAFLRRHLLGDESAAELLDGIIEPPTSDVTLTVGGAGR